jgi:cellulose synthase (UDP-forming)
VQTPQEFYNLESFEHEGAESPSQVSQDKPRYHEQELFYRAIQPGKNRWGAAFWCGTGAVLRVAALREVGGVATDTLTEDIHTTIRLHRRGWKTVYHNEVLARGLAATTSDQFQLQRFRWGTGAMQVLRSENPLFVPGLRLAQRIAYAATLSGWFEAWRSLGYLLLPIVVLLTGAVPVRVDPLVFALAFGVTYGIQQTALRLLNRRYHRLVLATLFDLVRMSPNISATLSLVWPGRPQFQVTPKGRQSDQRNRIEPPVLLVAVAILSVVAAVWSALTLAGLTPIHYEDPWFAYGALFWLTFGFVLICIAIARVHSERYGPERRSSVRFATGLVGVLDSAVCDILEISLTGAQVSTVSEPRPSAANGREVHKLAVGVPGRSLTLESLVRWRRPSEGGRTLVGLEFVDGQTAAQAQLALALLNGQVLPAPRRARLQLAA